MAYCTYCHYKWKLSEVIALGFSKNGKDCPHCGEKQFISRKTQNLMTLGYLSLLFLPYLFFKIKLSDRQADLYKKY